jgi:hypothetical protein
MSALAIRSEPPRRPPVFRVLIGLALLAAVAFALAGCTPVVIVQVRSAPGVAPPPPRAGPNPCDTRDCTPRVDPRSIA